MFKSIIAICVGASVGACLRWYLAEQFNALFPALPPGTWMANMLGGFIIGVAIAFFMLNPNISPEWRLLVVTGFCGGLTTFSTFSAELFGLLQSGRYLWAVITGSAHLFGSLLMTTVGFMSFKLVTGN